MARIKFGWNSGPGKGEEVPVAADQYFNRLGGRFVYMSAGNANLRLDATVTDAAKTLFGWLEAPKDDELESAWKSSSTAGKDKAFVIVGLEDKYWVPLDLASASAAASLVGGFATLKHTGATYALKQKAYYIGTAASANLIIHDYDVDDDALLVSIKPDMFA